MAQRYQLVGALGRLNTGDARRGQHITLGQGTVRQQLKRLSAHHDSSRGNGLSACLSLVANIDHVGFALGIEVG